MSRISPSYLSVFNTRAAFLACWLESNKARPTSTHWQTLAIFIVPGIFTVCQFQIFSMVSSNGSSRPASPVSEVTNQSTQEPALPSPRSQADKQNRRRLSTANTPHPPRSRASSMSSLSSGDFTMDDYTVDLSKIRDDTSDQNEAHSKKSSNSVPTPPQREIDRASSQDDGPTDFTLNMEQWIRGSKPYLRNEMEIGPLDSNPQPPKPTVEDYNDESVFILQSASTPAHQGPSEQTQTSVDFHVPRIAELEDQLENVNSELLMADIKLQSAQVEKKSLEAQLNKIMTSTTTQINALKTLLERSQQEKAALATQLETQHRATTTKIHTLETDLQTSTTARDTALAKSQTLATELLQSKQQLHTALNLLEAMEPTTQPPCESTTTNSAHIHTLELQLQTSKTAHEATASKVSELTTELKQTQMQLHSTLQLLDTMTLTNTRRNASSHEHDQSRGTQTSASLLPRRTCTCTSTSSTPDEAKAKPQAQAATDPRAHDDDLILHLHNTLINTRNALKRQRAHAEAVDAARGQKVAKKIQQLEERCEREVEQLRRERDEVGRERDFMGKVLMGLWGELEVGKGIEGGRQGYRYKYFRRDGAGGGLREVKEGV